MYVRTTPTNKRPKVPEICARPPSSFPLSPVSVPVEGILLWKRVGPEDGRGQLPSALLPALRLLLLPGGPLGRDLQLPLGPPAGATLAGRRRRRRRHGGGRHSAHECLVRGN